MNGGHSGSFLKRIVLAGALISILAIGFYGYQVWVAVSQDLVWKRKVKRQINIEETRAWALEVAKQANFYGPVTEHQTFLTNAPTYLLRNYKRRPYLGLGPDCIHLRYGGGMYSWGLTIGVTNLPPSSARGNNVEVWAPGIYFWNQ